jgi:hypothetical protein
MSVELKEFAKIIALKLDFTPSLSKLVEVSLRSLMVVVKYLT